MLVVESLHMAPVRDISETVGNQIWQCAKYRPFTMETLKLKSPEINVSLKGEIIHGLLTKHMKHCICKFLLFYFVSTTSYATNHI